MILSEEEGWLLVDVVECLMDVLLDVRLLVDSVFRLG